MKVIHLVFLLLLPASSATVAANTPPLISDVADQVIAWNTTTATNYFTIGDAETTFSSLTVTALSDNVTLVPNTTANLILGGTNSQRTIKVAPAANQTGVAVITLTVSDGTNTAGSSFNVTVTAPNTPPALTGLTNYQIIGPGQTPAAVAFTVGDAETAAGSLTVVASSSNTNLVPNANLALGGSGANRTVQVTPVVGQRGAAVIKLRVTDALGMAAQGEFIFSVFDEASANNGFAQPRGIFVLDSGAGTNINGVSMRDANIRNKPFVDGYLLRTEWATLEPADGVFDFTIITNIFARLPANQKLSLLIGSGVLPPWLLTLPGVTNWTAGTPSVTAPLPWNAVAQERYRLLLVALGNLVVDGAPLRNHPRFAAIDAWIPGLKSGIRDPDQIKIRNMADYSRSNMEHCVLTHLANVTDNFPNVPVQIGFWTYVDNQDASFGGVTPWEQLRQVILTNFNGVARPRVGFWMENLAANRPAAETDPWAGLPTTTFTAPLFLSQSNTFVGFQVLGSWSRPFDAAHVDNLLNGTPEDGMDYGFNTFQCRYYEQYQADVDFANYAAEFQRWHDFLNALPAPPGPLTGRIALTPTNAVRISFTAAASQVYQLLASTNLVNWSLRTTLTNPNAFSAELEWFDSLDSAARFYRLLQGAPSNPPPAFTVNFSNATNWTYTDMQRSFTGILLKPAGGGPFPAVIINYGTGGSLFGTNNYAINKANEMLPWGLVCIAPNLTHGSAGSADTNTWGYSPENLAREQACVNILASLGYVDTNRLALWGHSRGAFLTAGTASALGNQIRAAGMSAGGIEDDAAVTDPAYPTVTEAQGVTAPFIMFHGDVDPVVPPANSLRLQNLLITNGVPNSRILYVVSTNAFTDRHNIQNIPAVNADMLNQFHAWLQTYGVLP
ncbi:MAG: dienelactone hydrolase family protein [Verrucomicrobiales bacterium]|nr:dienelactone hydrolase family protein [Verrucomicrobiales bacterium]